MQKSAPLFGGTGAALSTASVVGSWCAFVFGMRTDAEDNGVMIHPYDFLFYAGLGCAVLGLVAGIVALWRQERWKALGIYATVASVPGVSYVMLAPFIYFLGRIRA